ncbi:hypothetical protein K502DRAFT_343413 [Neoconidiobolus thromboides FSU 785]|nr:hypothetical protein K502DRAFT_343413 [Neoconidiobolus thromboides FSU 785]
MGCCGSKANNSEPNESTHLLSSSNPITEPLAGQPNMEAQNYEAEILEREAATLNEIVQKTAENLIDISRIHSIERVKIQDGNLRSEEYQQAINDTSKFELLDKDQKRLSQLFDLPLSSSHNNTNMEAREDKVEQMLGMTLSPNNRRKMESLNNLSIKLANQLEEIHVDSTNEFIVPLTFGSNTPTISNH